MEQYKVSNHLDKKEHKIAVVSKVNKNGTVEIEESTYRPKTYPKPHTKNEYKPKGDIKVFKTNKPYKKKEEKFDIDKWLKQHQNIEAPKRGKKNSLGDKKNKRRH